MFSIAFFSLASLALSALAAPHSHEGTTHAHNIKVDTNPVPHVGRDVPQIACPGSLVEFITNFKVPLVNLEAIMSEASDAEALAKVVVPALGNVITPMVVLLGKLDIMGQAGVSAQNGTVTVSTDQISKTLGDYGTRLTACLSKASTLIGQSFPEVAMCIKTVMVMWSAVLYLVSTISGITSLITTPLLGITTSLAKLGVCAATSLGLGL